VIKKIVVPDSLTERISTGQEAVITQCYLPHSQVCVCMYVCMYERINNSLNSNSLSSHECAPVGQTEKMCL